MLNGFTIAQKVKGVCNIVFCSALILFTVSSVSSVTIDKSAKYNGPINHRLLVKVYNQKENRSEILRNGYIYVNTIKNSDQGRGVNNYLKTNRYGYTYLTLPAQAAGAEITLYKVSANTSYMYLLCKLSKVNGSAKNYIAINAVENANNIEDEVILTGFDCSKD